jgi:two-component system sensor histidine kinase ChvG
MGQPSRIGQVITNLIDNARSFSPRGGNIRMALRLARMDGDETPWREGVEIIVDDDGPGIPPEALERIFERFYTDRPNQGFGQNSGLGLSIARQIVAAYGGIIEAQNRDDSTGARFRIWLPRIAASEQADSPVSGSGQTRYEA